MSANALLEVLNGCYEAEEARALLQQALEQEDDWEEKTT